MTRAKNRPTEQRAERTRRPFLEDESADILTVEGKDPNYVYRWVNDQRGRVQRLIDAGYDVVTDEHKIAATLDSGSINTITVNRAHGDKGVLMRILKDWYEEDAEKRAKNIADTEAMFLDQQREEDGRYGTLTKE